MSSAQNREVVLAARNELAQEEVLPTCKVEEIDLEEAIGLLSKEAV